MIETESYRPNKLLDVFTPAAIGFAANAFIIMVSKAEMTIELAISSGIAALGLSALAYGLNNYLNNEEGYRDSKEGGLLDTKAYGGLGATTVSFVGALGTSVCLTM